MTPGAPTVGSTVSLVDTSWLRTRSTVKSRWRAVLTSVRAARRSWSKLPMEIGCGPKLIVPVTPTEKDFQSWPGEGEGEILKGRLGGADFGAELGVPSERLVGRRGCPLRRG
jgi:hypothetical protein